MKKYVQIIPPQVSQGATEPGVSSGAARRLLQLQPDDGVERGLADGGPQLSDWRQTHAGQRLHSQHVPALGRGIQINGSHSELFFTISCWANNYQLPMQPFSILRQPKAVSFYVAGLCCDCPFVKCFPHQSPMCLGQGKRRATSSARIAHTTHTMLMSKCLSIEIPKGPILAVCTERPKMHLKTKTVHGTMGLRRLIRGKDGWKDALDIQDNKRG